VPGQPLAPVGAAGTAVPLANGIAHTAAAQQSSPGATLAPDGAADAVEAPSPEAPPASPAPPPKDLSPTDKLLVEASPLVGAWGEERYGFSDASVLQVPQHHSIARACYSSSRLAGQRSAACSSSMDLVLVAAERLARDSSPR
jgi:hypothetical protein